MNEVARNKLEVTFSGNQSSDTSCELNIVELCSESIAYLNQLTGSNFRLSSTGNRNLIAKLASNGFGRSDIHSVIEHKVKEWLHCVAMKKYLRPVTLFDRANFKRYHAEVMKLKNPRT